MMLNAKILVALGLVSYGVLARNADSNREFFKETGNKKQGGSMLLEIAKELVQRSSTSSQVNYMLNDCLSMLCCGINLKIKLKEVLIFNDVIVIGVEPEFVQFVTAFGTEGRRIWSRIFRTPWLQGA